MKILVLFISLIVSLLMSSCATHLDQDSISEDYYIEFKLISEAGTFRKYPIEFEYSESESDCIEMKILKPFLGTDWRPLAYLQFQNADQTESAMIHLSQIRSENTSLSFGFKMNNVEPENETFMEENIGYGEKFKFKINYLDNQKIQILSPNTQETFKLSFAPKNLYFGTSSAESSIKFSNPRSCDYL